ncbi:hypothetical protein [Mesorhizobium sp. WSM4313]|uniref:hypothetical protein n=1 Tax=Mesorhizobium sp. WSM4313 TaxID=2029412 RepID=UPI001FD93906|nr:hypothetical protein [Mesorhizobium sp. WSM4313]
MIFATSLGRAPAAAIARPRLANTLARLSREIALADKLAVQVFRFLAGDKYQPGALRHDDLAVCVRLGQIVGIDAFKRHCDRLSYSDFRPYPDF